MDKLTEMMERLLNLLKAEQEKNTLLEKMLAEKK